MQSRVLHLIDKILHGDRSSSQRNITGTLGFPQVRKRFPQGPGERKVEHAMNGQEKMLFCH
jgi:hypothetical protein